MISYLKACLQETSLTLHQVEVLLSYVLETSYICNHSPNLSKSINLEAKLFHLSRNVLLAPLHPLHIQIVNLFAWILSRHSVCLGQIFQARSFNTVAPGSFIQEGLKFQNQNWIVLVLRKHWPKITQRNESASPRLLRKAKKIGTGYDQKLPKAQLTWEFSLFDEIAA